MLHTCKLRAKYSQQYAQNVCSIFILQSSMLQRFTAESSRELSALRKLNNKQKQVSMFLILLFKLLSQLPFLFSLLPFSILSLFPSPIPSFSSDQFSVFLRHKSSLHSVSLMAHFFCILFHTMTFFLIMHSISLYKF